MNRSTVLPLVSAALILLAASHRSTAQSGIGSAPSKTNVARRTHAAVAPPRNAAPTADQPPTGAFDEPADSHHKTWKDLAHAKTDGKTEKPSAAYSSWSALGALVVVVGLILVIARLLRRHAPMFQQSLPTDALEILGRRAIDPRQSILLVRIGSRILVVGSSPNGLNPLGQIDDAVEVDVLAGLCRRGPQAGILGASFFKLLKGDSGARPATGVRQTAPRAPITEPPLTASLESPDERTSQPEYDLLRRLRKPAAATQVDTREDL
jgi:flagellar biogenesis protein FliO